MTRTRACPRFRGPMSPPQALSDVIVVFDLDGTLIDTAPDLVHATNHVLATEGLSPLASETIKPWISFGAGKMIEEALAVHGLTCAEGQKETLLRRFLQYYSENIAVESRPFPGMRECLDGLTADGAVLAVCTNKREGLSRKLLDALGLSALFRAVAGRDTLPVSKPNPGHLTGTIALAGANGRRALLIGDSETDVLTARAARLPIIGVSFGYTDVPMRDLNPDALIDRYSELRPVIDHIMGKRRH
jgi:phosphoglycolate phosphatase